MIDRRLFICAMGATLIGAPSRTSAQQPVKLPRVGVLASASPPHPFADAFWRGLHGLGYSEGQNIVVEFRYSDGEATAPRSSLRSLSGSASMSSSRITP